MIFKENVEQGGEKEKTSSEETRSKTEVVIKKNDVSKLLSIIPPPSQLRKPEEKKLAEKRIRIKYDSALPKDTARISKELASYLGVNENDKIEIVVAGRKKFIFNVIIDEETEQNIVYCYPEELKENGVADNSIATIRRYVPGVKSK